MKRAVACLLAVVLFCAAALPMAVYADVLDEKLQVLRKHLKEHPEVEIVFFDGNAVKGLFFHQADECLIHFYGGVAVFFLMFVHYK